MDRYTTYSDKFEVRWVEPIPPTWRDVWAILRGKYKPQLRECSRLTVAGADRELKKHYVEPLVEALNDKRPFFERMRKDD